nr:MAG TPA: hypothetical protein [Caudoviricetes sp.]
MTWYERIIAAHTAVTDSVSHSARLASDRYFVWQEDGSNDLAGDNGHGETAVTGTTDLYTKQEFDPWADALGESLSSYGISWRLDNVQYEEDTGFYHYEWLWEVP